MCLNYVHQRHQSGFRNLFIINSLFFIIIHKLEHIQNMQNNNKKTSAETIKIKITEDWTLKVETAQIID